MKPITTILLIRLYRSENGFWKQNMDLNIVTWNETCFERTGDSQNLANYNIKIAVIQEV